MKTALKILLYLLVGLFLLLLVVLATLPYSVPPVAKKLAKDQGIELTIREIAIHWLEGQVELHGISAGALQSDAGINTGNINNAPVAATLENRPATINTFAVDLALRKLVKERKLIVESLFLSGINVPVDVAIDTNQKIASVHVAGIDIASFSSAEPDSDEEGTEGEPPIEFQGWNALKVDDFNVAANIYSPDQALDFPLAIKSLDIGELSLLSVNEKTPISGHLYINESILKFSGDAAPFGAGREGHAALRLDEFNLSRWFSLAEFFNVSVANVRSLTGKLELVTNVHWWLAGDRNFITLESTDFHANGLSAALKLDSEKEALQNAAADFSLNFDKFKVETNPVKYTAENLVLEGKKLVYEDLNADSPLDVGVAKLLFELGTLDGVAGNNNPVKINSLNLALDKIDLGFGAATKETSSQKAGGNLAVQAENLKIETSPLNYAFQNLEISSDEFSYADEKLDPPMEVAIQELSVNLNALDSQKASAVSRVDFSTGVGRYGKVKITGEGNFLDKKASAKIHANGEQLNLPSFSGLAKNAIGKHIDKGALDFSYDANVNDGKLDSKAKIQAHQLSLSGDFGTSSNIVEELGMPLNAALNLLRDKDDTVRLSVPVKGDFHDPQVKIGNIVNKALLNGVKTAALTQFGPLMALSALDKARTLADGLKLKPVEFDSQQVEVNVQLQENGKRLEAIAKLLGNRPKIRLNVCGYANSGELTANAGNSQPGEAGGNSVPELDEQQKKQLYDMAATRADNIKDWLMQQEIDGRQLILCAPLVSSEPDAGPRVEFSL